MGCEEDKIGCRRLQKQIGRLGWKKDGLTSVSWSPAGGRSRGAPLPYFDLFAPKSIDEKSSNLFLSHFGAFWAHFFIKMTLGTTQCLSIAPGLLFFKLIGAFFRLPGRDPEPGIGKCKIDLVNFFFSFPDHLNRIVSRRSERGFRSWSWNWNCSWLPVKYGFYSIKQ